MVLSRPPRNGLLLRVSEAGVVVHFGTLLIKIAGGTPKKAKTATKVKAEVAEEEVEAEEQDFEDANE
jgi:hypothetical protein